MNARDACSIICPVKETALRDPQSVAISSPERTITYRELDRTAGNAARKIREYGLSGERVGVYMDKGVEQIALVFALIRSRSVTVQIPTRIPPSKAPDFLLRAGCAALVTDKEDAASPDTRTFSPEDFSDAEIRSMDDKPRMPFSQPATVVFTSGSTGTPKAALHTFGNHYASAVGSGGNIPLKPGDVWLHSLPLFHVGGLSILFRCAIAGAAIALPDAGETIGESIRRSGATHVSLVATQLRRLLDEDADLSGIGTILLGGSGIPETLLDRVHRLGLPVHTSYGLTEMASQVTTTAPGAGRAELATSGRLLPHRKLRISDAGEILVKGDTLFAGYVEGEKTASPLDSEGWFHTKDLGALDESGLLTVTGRLDNLFISGGENIQPEEVEEALRRVSGVEDAVVVPIPDKEFGERPVAFVKGEMPEHLSATLRETLSGFKVPVAFYGWPDDSPSGMKVDREFFRERATEQRPEEKRLES